jgi:hypothetical protein
VRNLAATALVIGAVVAIGWRPAAGPLAWAGAIAMIVLFILALSWLAACFGLLVGSWRWRPPPPAGCSGTARPGTDRAPSGSINGRFVN